jgi:hypothetical protein
VSSTFNPSYGAWSGDTVDAILVKIASRAASPSGTVTVGLYNALGNLKTESTVNISDIPTDCKGWVCITIADTVLGYENHTIRIKTSASSQLTIFGTSSTNWCRCLRRKLDNTAGTGGVNPYRTPETNDEIIIVGELTGAGTSNTLTVTHNETATTTYDTLEVGHKGIWKWGTSASTNYYFKTSDNIVFGSGSETYIGDTTTALPSTSTATIEVVPATNAAVGIYALSNSKVVTRAALQPTPIAQLAADVAASGTGLTTDVTTNWKSGQTLLITGTGAVTQYEEKALSADASGTSVTVNAVTNAHTGTGDTKAHVGNITRSITIKGTSTSLNTFFYAGPTALTTLDFEYTIFENMGANVATKYGVVIDTFSGSGSDVKFLGCVFENFTIAGTAHLWVNSPAIEKCRVEDCIFYNVNGLHFRNEVQSLTSANLILKNCLAAVNIRQSSDGFLLQSKSWQVDDLYVWNSNQTGTFCISAATVNANYQNNGSFDYKWSNLQAHMNTSVPMRILRARNSIFGNLFFTKGNSSGAIYLQGKDFISIDELKVRDGNGIRGQDVSTNLLRIGKVDINANSVSNTVGFLMLWDCQFEIDELTITGTTGDSIQVGTTTTFQNTLIRLVSNKTSISSYSGTYNPNGYLKFGNWSNTANTIRHVYKYGELRTSTSEFNTASPSIEMIPNNASNKLKSTEKKIAVANGNTATVKVYVKKSATYNGNQVQLMVKKDAQSGVTVDTQLTVSTSASDNAWEELSGTLPTASGDVVYTVYLTCDGTAGSVYTDDWSVT